MEATPGYEGVVDRVQYITNTLYKIKAPDSTKILFNAYISDPQPRIPRGFNTHKGISLGDYVLVHSESVQSANSTAARNYKFVADDGYVMDSEWNNFDDDQSVIALVGDNESFLVYRELIVVSKAQAGAPNADNTARKSAPAKGSRKGKK
jgi:hypothetical protein